MRDLPYGKAKQIAEAFRVAIVMAENIADSVYARDDVSTAAADEIAQDAVIVAGRIKAASEVITEAYPGFAGIMDQVAREAEDRARKMQDNGLI